MIGEMKVRVRSEEFTRVLDRYIEALRWCSGSDGFGFGDKASGKDPISIPLSDTLFRVFCFQHKIEMIFR